MGLRGTEFPPRSIGGTKTHENFQILPDCGACGARPRRRPSRPPRGRPAAEAGEIFYLIFVRSFRDSNGDGRGDLRGIEDELGYLQDLGVTTIVLTPLYQSPLYHSYFATDFSKIDPAYGTEADFRHLVRALHRRGMKIFIDEEVQYVTAEHEWFRDALNNPKSRFSHFVLFHGPGNTLPEPGPYGLTELPVVRREPGSASPRSTCTTPRSWTTRPGSSSTG